MTSATRGRIRLAILAVVATVSMLALYASAADAALVRNNAFGSAGSGAGQFANPRGVAVDQSTGDIYVADQNQSRLEKFSSDGTFEQAWGWGVSDGTSELQTCTTTCQAGQFGNGDGQLGTPTSVAVDSTTHDVYVGDSSFNRVEKYSAAGALQSTIDGSTSTEGTFQSLAGIAVDHSGNLWTDDAFTGNIDKFDNTGAFVQQWNDNYGTTSNAGIAVDSTHNAVYLISNQSNADKWSLTGTGRTTLTSTFSVSGLAVDPISGDLYVADTSAGNQFLVFDTSGTQTDSFPASGIVQFGGLAFRHSTSQLAVSDQMSNDVATFVPAVPGPPVVDGESASNITRDSATLNAQVDPFGNDTTCTFQYVDDATFQSTTWADATSTPCTPADLGSSFTDQAATADITGLDHSTTYHFRVVATNGTDTTDGPDTTFTTLSDPSIDSESATAVTDTTATLEAQINPNGGDATYQFQFGTDTSYSGGKVPAQPVDLGSGLSDAAASADLTGLTPDTTYHFQLIINGTPEANDHTFHTFASNLPNGLPDGRGPEMVTPAVKDNGEPYLRAGQILGPTVTSPTGTSLSWFSLNALPGSLFDGAFYVSNRGAANWTTTPMIPPQATEQSLLCATIAPEVVGYSQDMSQGVLADGGNAPFCSADDPPLVPGEPTGAQNLFVRNASGKYLLVDPAPIGGAAPADATFDGASTDLSTVVFDELAQLTNNAPAGSDDLYASSPSAAPNPTAQLVTVLPDGTAVAGSLAGGNSGDAFHAISDDGSKVFFTANGNLYVRKSPLGPSASTVQVDEGIGGGGNFLAATSDGSKVFFTDSSGGHLYQDDLTSNTLTDLTPAGGAGIFGLAGINGSGSALYFVANAALTSTPDPGATPSTPTAGQPNLYLLPDGDNTKIAFIATLSGSDSNDWSPDQLSARVSSSGSFLAFTSINSLTGYNNNNAPEIFVYNSAAKTLNCASCSPGGGLPVSGAAIHPPYTPVDFAHGEFLQRNVSDSGQVFFDTTDALVPTVSHNGVSDVYEWEANGTGSCASTVENGGCLYLLSSGTSSSPAFFADASPSGSDMFFVTNDQLVPQDTDLAADYYDLRVGGGFPASAPPPVCQGDACKPPQSATPPAPVVATVTFFGPGNVTGASSGKKHKKHKKHRKHKKHALIAVLTQRITSNRLDVRIRVPASGRISVDGVGLKGSSRTVRAAGIYTLSAHLTSRAMTALETKHKLKLAIRVRYARAAGGASAATVELTVKA